jgi:four helix bundle protein
MKGPVYQKSMILSVKIIEVYNFMQSRNEFVISKQLLASGTSVGANIREAAAAVSRNDFINKMAIANKEAKETKYWLEVIDQSKIANYDVTDLIKLNDELIKILTSIVLTAKNNLKTRNNE